ncbi:MAG: methyltransferase domain-containing protein [Deltaproteobacteria bacterium]|nr:methyltransferase domain-containing protein [Deltaproteobacteria bacterium]
MAHPLTHGLDIDSPEMTIRRARIIQEKVFLKYFYQKCYLSLAESLPNSINGPVLEIGSGAGFIKECIAGLLTSEILHIPGVDVICDGQKLPFRSASLRGIVMLDVLHHIPCVKFFLSTAAHCVKPGGAIVMIEPWNTRWSQFVYKHLHHEPFDPKAGQWNLPSSGPLSQANSALPWIIFERDREVFKQEFPIWQLKKISLHSPLSYLLSGGISYRVSLPAILFKTCKHFEDFLSPWIESWAMFATIVLIRRANGI